MVYLIIQAKEEETSRVSVRSELVWMTKKMIHNTVSNVESAMTEGDLLQQHL